MILRKNLRRYALTGAYKIHKNQISLPCPSSRKIYSKIYIENIASNKVTTKKEYPCTKETTYQEITHLGPKNKIMNEESYTKPSKKVPDQIFDNPEVTTQEPKEPQIEMSDFEKKMENPFACSICRVAFAEPHDLENHVEMHLQRLTPVALGALGETEVNPKPGSPPVVDPNPGLLAAAPGVVGTTDADPKVDLPEILKPPTQVATLGLAPGGEVEEEPKSDPSAFYWEPSTPGDLFTPHVKNTVPKPNAPNEEMPGNLE